MYVLIYGCVCVCVCVLMYTQYYPYYPCITLCFGVFSSQFQSNINGLHDITHITHEIAFYKVSENTPLDFSVS